MRRQSRRMEKAKDVTSSVPILTASGAGAGAAAWRPAQPAWPRG
ncbi:MAG: hypothetical protein WDO17_17515 [Alphaproteobacteria bacterium]